MSANNYNSYNYPYQQSSAQQYSAYQTAPPVNNVAQPARQYQQPPTTQGNEYSSYQAHAYSGQSSGYATGQDSSWTGSNYGGNRETTSRAAEVLRNMSNNSYTPTTTAATQAAYTTTNSAASQHARYSSGTSHSPHMQPQRTNSPHTTYEQSQSRPRSVNTNRAAQATNRALPSPATAAGYPSQRTQAIFNQQQQRSASPAQHQYSNTPQAPQATVASARGSTMSAVPAQQYPDYDRRQIASVEAPNTNQSAASSSSYGYGNSSTIAQPGPIAPPASSIAETYISQGSTTVDPTAVYDPWPEYQRKQEAIRAQKAIGNAARAEEEGIAEEARQAEEAKKEQERQRQEGQAAANQPKPKGKKAQSQQQGTEVISAASEAPAATGEALESEIRAMMAKMRELNSKDPALLARIWEEERRAKASPKSPVVQSKPAAQVTPAPPAQAVQTAPQAANQRKKAVPKEPGTTSRAKAPTPAPAPVPAAPIARMQPPPPAARPGNTIWPPEKKTQLAAAAAAYLNTRNASNPIDPATVLALLNINPSYIELCEQLEQMGFSLDRATFAKDLLTAVPDVNSSTRKTAPQPAPVQRAQVPPAIMKKEVGTPAAPSPARDSPYPQYAHTAPPIATPAPVAEMVPIKAELKPLADKEEAARKRNISDLIDMTLLSDEEDMGPPPKKLNADTMYSYNHHQSPVEDGMIVDSEPAVNNFPIASIPMRAPEPPRQPAPLPDRETRVVSESLDKKKALRRNNYNPATIARDVLLACGRHPSQRQLNQHLDVLRTNLSNITFDTDLSTIKWELLDPGSAPPGYFNDSVQALTEDADDEDDSEDEDKEARPRAPSNAIGGEGGARVQALPEAINPFKPKKRGRPPRHSFPDGTSPATPKRPTSSASMSASVPRPSPGSVGYSAFRTATEYGPDGQPLPKKRGRPVGWRKAIHGSATAQARPSGNGHTGPFVKHQPSQPSSLRNVNSGPNEPIRIDSRSPNVANRVPRFQAYKCKWQNCTAELHNLETLKKHVFKVHRKETPQHTLECLWGDCGKEVTSFDPNTNLSIEKHAPHSFDLYSSWQGHVQQHHFAPLSWELGDGPASGLSDAYDSEAYLSDAQGRRVTPRITVDIERIERASSLARDSASAPRRGWPAKITQEQEAREAQERIVLQKKRIGGPGMDRGGATLANDKRRRGFNDSDGVEDELVDVEE